MESTSRPDFHQKNFQNLEETSSSEKLKPTQIASATLLVKQEERILRQIRDVMFLGKVRNPEMIQNVRELLDQIKKDLSSLKETLLDNYPTEDDYLSFMEYITENTKILDAYSTLNDEEQSEVYNEFNKLNKLKNVQEIFEDNLMVTGDVQKLYQIVREQKLPILTRILEAGQK